MPFAITEASLPFKFYTTLIRLKADQWLEAAVPQPCKCMAHTEQDYGSRYHT